MTNWAPAKGHSDFFKHYEFAVAVSKEVINVQQKLMKKK